MNRKIGGCNQRRHIGDQHHGERSDLAGLELPSNVDQLVRSAVTPSWQFAHMLNSCFVFDRPLPLVERRTQVALTGGEWLAR